MTEPRSTASDSPISAEALPQPPPSPAGPESTAAGTLPTLEFPALYTAADAASLAGQQGYKWLVVADLVLLAVAAITTLGGQFSAVSRWSRVIAAALLAGALVAKVAARTRAFDTQWFDGRAVSETVKSATWRYAMHAAPFTNPAAANAAFASTLHETLQARPSLVPYLYQIPADGRQITPGMEQVRAAPLETRRQLYIAQRLADQMHWYATKAAGNSRAASRWFWAGIAAQGLALIVAIVIIQDQPPVPDVVAVLTTIAAAIAAWTQFRRHDELSKSYSLAAHELAFLRSEVETATGEETFRKAVAATEDAISREHTMWMAKRS